jgi:hypothetical protein
MGMSGLGDFEAELYGDIDNDEDLEAELMALQGKPQPKKRRPKGMWKLSNCFKSLVWQLHFCGMVVGGERNILYMYTFDLRCLPVKC